MRCVLPGRRVRQRGGHFQAGVRGLLRLPHFNWYLRDPARRSDTALAALAAALAALAAALTALPARRVPEHVLGW